MFPMPFLQDPFSDEDFVENKKAPKWIQTLFHWFMMGVLLSLVFGVSGCFLFLQLAGGGKSSTGWAQTITPTGGWILFGSGGCIGLAWFIRMMTRREP